MERQSTVCDPCVLRSRFNRETYELFHRSPKVPQLDHTLHHAAREVQAVDVIRCRFSALTRQEDDFCVFSPLDDIEPRGGQLGDYNWISGCQARSPLMALPFWGPGWYSRELARDLLEQRIVRWDHITHVFSSSAHMPASYVRPRLQAIERCWGDHGKQAMNALFGLMSKAEQRRHYLVCTTEDQDCLSSAPKIVRRARATSGSGTTCASRGCSPTPAGGPSTSGRWSSSACSSRGPAAS
jgi:hypothetical protein